MDGSMDLGLQEELPVAGVTLFRDRPALDIREHRATGFLAVRARRETAWRGAPDLGEYVGDLRHGGLPQRDAPDAGSVDHQPAFRQRVEPRARRGMPPLP